MYRGLYVSVTPSSSLTAAASFFVLRALHGISLIIMLAIWARRHEMQELIFMPEMEPYPVS